MLCAFLYIVVPLLLGKIYKLYDLFVKVIHARFYKLVLMNLR